MKKSFVRGTWQVKRAFSPAVIAEGAGRTIFIAAQEGEFMGGGVGEVHGAKLVGLLQRALQLRPVYAEAHFNLARAFAAAGRRDEATHAAAIAKKEATAAEKTRLAGQIDDLLRSLGR